MPDSIDSELAAQINPLGSPSFSSNFTPFDALAFIKACFLR
jgi:hypothetical protein